MLGASDFVKGKGKREKAKVEGRRVKECPPSPSAFRLSP
jgi:hypothetical protein